MWRIDYVMSTPLIIVSTCLFSVCVAYITLAYNFNKLRDQYQKIFIDMMLLDKLINDIEESKIKSDESVHKENFIKFLSDSREMAYDYIETVQNGINKFIKEIEPEIKYFDEFGIIDTFHPTYYSMKKISQEYQELKNLLPKENN